MNKQPRSLRSITWLTVTFFLATLPATALSLYALIAILFGIQFLADSLGASVILILWGSGGLFGAAALWALNIIAAPRPDWITGGLWSGLFAVLPLTLYAVSELAGRPSAILKIASEPEGLLIVIAPLTLPVIACVELIRLRRESAQALQVPS
ncbi:MAG: hypothetical protein AAAFM81_05530 [Pseudomonadota bacterium]